MKYFTTTGAVLLSVLTATAGGIKFDPEDEGTSIARQSGREEKTWDDDETGFLGVLLTLG